MKALLSSHHFTPEHVAAFKKLIGGERVERALFITCAAVPYDSPQPEWVEESFAPLRPLAEHVDETTLEDNSLVPDDLSEYGFVFVSGGNSFYLAHQLKGTGMDARLRAYVEHGGVYAGSSAGAIILMDSIAHFAPADDPSVVPRIDPGLGLIDVALIPHADSAKYSELMKGIASAYERGGYTIVLLTDDQAFYIDEHESGVI